MQRSQAEGLDQERRGGRYAGQGTVEEGRCESLGDIERVGLSSGILEPNICLSPLFESFILKEMDR